MDQLTQLSWCESTLPNTEIPKYVPWKHTFQTHVIYPTCCRRRVTVLSSSPFSHRSATCGTRNIERCSQKLPLILQLSMSQATLDASTVNENHNILPPLLSLCTISFKSLRNIRLLEPPCPDDHIRVAFPTRVLYNPQHHHKYAKFHIEVGFKSEVKSDDYNFRAV